MKKKTQGKYSERPSECRDGSIVIEKPQRIVFSYAACGEVFSCEHARREMWSEGKMMEVVKSMLYDVFFFLPVQ